MISWIQKKLESGMQYLNGNSRMYIERHQSTHTANLSDKDIAKVRNTSNTIISMMIDGGTLEQIQEILAQCPHKIQVFSERDVNGYNLLQYAIIYNKADVVDFCVKLGADVNLPICGRPLHLACKLGHVDIARILLGSGADPEAMACVCYPSRHIQAIYHYSHTDASWNLICPGDIYSAESLKKCIFEYPLYYAIQSNNIECLQLMMLHSSLLVKTSQPLLHVTCSLGSIDCVKYFCEKKYNINGKVSPSSPQREINSIDNEGRLPVHYAVRWGKPFVEYLVLHGAQVQIKTQRQHTLLHLLYMGDAKVEDMVDCTKYLLSCGLSMNINAVDKAGNSALHYLLDLVHKTVFKEQRPRFNVDLSPDLTISPTKLQETVTRTNVILECAELLLREGINPNIANKSGDTALHVLCRLDKKSVGIMFESSKNEKLPFSLNAVRNLIVLLLKYNANANLMNNTELTVLDLLMKNSFEHLFTRVLWRYSLHPEEVHNLIDCLIVLHQNGCNFNWPQSGIVYLQMVLNQLARVDQVGLYSPMSDVSTQKNYVVHYVEAIMEIIKTLLMCGCEGNTYKGSNSLHTAYYLLIQNQTGPLPVCLIREFLLLFLHYGVDPNVGAQHLPLAVLRRSSSPTIRPVYPLLHVLNLMTSPSATRGHNLQSSDLFVLFELFYCSMDEKSARRCLQHFIDYDSSSCKDTLVYDQVWMLLHNVNSLMQLSRAVIYKSLNRQLLRRVNMLPLPKQLLEYILQFHF